MLKITQMSLVMALATAVFTSNAEVTKEPLTKLVSIELADQFDKIQNVDENTKVLIFAHDMEGNDIVEKAFEPYDGAKLAELNVVFLADISGMPSLIGKLFALPAMRDRAYPIMLDREGTLGKKFTVKEDHVTVMYLDKLAIQQSKLVASSEQLTSLLRSLNK